jgi:hypothetical protein
LRLAGRVLPEQDSPERRSSSNAIRPMASAKVAGDGQELVVGIEGEPRFELAQR